MIYLPDIHIDDFLFIASVDFQLRWRFFRYHYHRAHIAIFIAVSTGRFPELTSINAPVYRLFTLNDGVIKLVIQLCCHFLIRTACNHAFWNLQLNFGHRTWVKFYRFGRVTDGIHCGANNPFLGGFLRRGERYKCSAAICLAAQGFTVTAPRYGFIYCQKLTILIGDFNRERFLRGDFGTFGRLNKADAKRVRKINNQRHCLVLNDIAAGCTTAQRSVWRS